MEDKIEKEVLVKLLESRKRSSGTAFREALKEFMPNKHNLRFQICCSVLSAFFAIYISISCNTVILCRDIINYLGDITIAILAIVFTGYAFFQALIEPGFFKRLLKSEREGKTFLQISNDYFINVMMMLFGVFIVDIILNLMLRIMPDYFILSLPMLVNVGLSILGLSLVFYIHFIVIWEIKSFIFNIYQVFTLSAIEKANEIIKEEREKEQKNN